ncbi:MAG: NAD(P)H-hydrate dehydratase [Chitinophagaceae bacterium]|nr:NAD(P)H-hydrate dehydratase [Chitinophagaceae bacterium]
MKIFNAAEIKAWDQFTIQHEPISSIDLMERAAGMCVEWIKQNELLSHPFIIFCGKGNNGGDGLAIGRMLAELFCNVTVYIIESGYMGTAEFQVNLARLHQTRADIRYIQTEENFHELNPPAIIIDALFGAGLNRPLEGITAKLAAHINHSRCGVMAIDIPSGLFTDQSSKGNIAVKANDTLSFQCYKTAFLVAENAEFIGKIHLLDIGLHPQFYRSTDNLLAIADWDIIHSIYKPRNRFAHKGTFGHALLVAGSYGKIGAAVLSAKSCLRSGAGLLTCHVPACGYQIVQSTVPEAMVSTDFNSSFNTKIEDDLSKFDALGIGPGIGTASETKTMLREIFTSCDSPVVVDADALNIIASQKDLLQIIPANSIITPHPKEFERLFGPSANDFERIQLAMQKAKEYNVVIVLKGHHSFIASPDAKYIFNNTGNAGMATAGSGDVLTGILTGLLAQGYPAFNAAVLGVYLHGLAGDIAAKELSMEALLAGDIIQYLGEGFTHL